MLGLSFLFHTQWRSHLLCHISEYSNDHDANEVQDAGKDKEMRGAAILLVLSLFLTPVSTTSADRINLRTTRRLAVPVLYSDMSVTRESEAVAKVLLMEVSAYSPSVQECDAAPTITASGKRVCVGGVAADWSVLPCGSIIVIPNYNNGNPCTVIDQGGAIQGNKLDVFFWHEQEAVNWGRRRNVRVEVLYIPRAK